MFDAKYLLLRMGIFLLTMAMFQGIIFGAMGIDSIEDGRITKADSASGDIPDLNNLSKFDIFIIGLKGIFTNPIGWVGFLLIGIYIYLKFIKK